MKQLPPERLRRFPPLSQRCALRAGGRRPCGGAALARRPWPGGVPVSCVTALNERIWLRNRKPVARILNN
ncbi:MAG: hypothetical protein C0492_05105 [Verminephrobacter sp.]|nr:hypothetical protein [Verminephrobacter sp.]